MNNLDNIKELLPAWGCSNIHCGIKIEWDLKVMHVIWCLWNKRNNMSGLRGD